MQHVSRAAVRTGIPYGFKATIDQVLMLARFGILKMYPAVQLVHITRSDTLGQAISLHIAWQTLQWTSEQKITGESEPRFDPATISNFLRQIGRANMLFPVVADLVGARFAQLTYEDLVARPRPTVVQTLAPLGHDVSDWRPTPAPIRKQADAVNDDFRRRYLAHLGAAT
jgi:LPS sulfotransferase NodH